MATKVKALTTIAGNYGRAAAGDELEVRDADAKALEEKGLVEIVGKGSSDEKAADFKEVNLTQQKADEADEGETVDDRAGVSGSDPKSTKQQASTSKKAGAKKAGRK